MTIKGTTVRKPEVWDKLVNSKFDGQPVLSPEDSLAAAKKLYRHAMGKPWPGTWKLTSGNRTTWPRRGVFAVNPDERRTSGRGLREIIHSISHYCHWKLNPNDKPHSLRQARLEAKLAKFAVDRGWHQGQPVNPVRAKVEVAEPVAKAKPDAVKVRFDRMVARRDKWQRELERAKRLLTKAEREVRAYQRRHGARVTG